MVKRYDVEGVVSPGGRYSHVAETEPGARFYHLAGRTGIHPDGTIGKDFTEQAELVYANLNQILKECGMTFDNLVKTTVFSRRSRGQAGASQSPEEGVRRCGAAEYAAHRKGPGSPRTANRGGCHCSQGLRILFQLPVLPTVEARFDNHVAKAQCVAGASAKVVKHKQRSNVALLEFAAENVAAINFDGWISLGEGQRDETHTCADIISACN